MQTRTAGRAVLTTLTTAAVTAAVTAATLTVPAAAATGGGDGRHAATRAAMEAQVTAGAVGVLGQARDGDGSWNASAGVADLRTHRPRIAQDHFRVGSISKAFTSVVLLQLEAEGKVGLDDSVERWLPGVVHGNGHDGSAVTIRQLLNHTSGIFNYTEDEGFISLLSKDFPEHRFDSFTPEELVATAMKHAPSFKPGTDWHYSNTNYILAGMIVEKVSGNSYADEIERRITGPLHLRHTSLPGTDPTVPGPHGRAYSKLTDPAPDAKIHDVTELNPSWGGAAGEIISTTGDLNTFYSALLGGKLLPERQQKELLTTVSTGKQIPGGRYGLGVMAATLPCGTTIWMHGGGIHGSMSMASGTADGRHTASFNFNDDWAGDSTPLLLAEYCGTDRPAPRSGVAASPSDVTATLKALAALR
ncbi:serine hydrolase domain-containing protein [Streptomyces gamaensis]|uniref:Serine hydrolase domain-containing protein n=1 Tax=Streptomyces gamaensis TaxID=1763542 RepID=A0ABW0Z6N9_9ACTN